MTDLSNPIIVGVAEHYAQFVRLCRKRIEDLGVTFETVDALCGFPARYTATLLCGAKAMSVYSFFTMARALALLPAFQHDQEQHELLAAREDWIKLRRKGLRWRAKHASAKHSLDPKYMRFIGLRGNLARYKKLTPKQRRAIARRAAQIRWSNANTGTE